MRIVGDERVARSDRQQELAAELSAAGFDCAEEVGHGGFSVVYRCQQAALNRVAAVKVLTGDLDEHRQRFQREQRAMGRLTGHPNIVVALQAGETDSGYPYLVMPYFERGSLDDRIRRFGLLPVDEVLVVGIKIAGALESAHRLGIVHRDVKPANIMLTDYGEPALSDFGIAHIAGGFETAAGVFTGTPAFVAPEVLAGEPPSPASDIYSLGSTLFCALTGHAAFERRSGEGVVAQFVRMAAGPVPDLRESGISDDISAVVQGAMCRDPRDRPSALAFGEALQQLQADRGLSVDEMTLQGSEQSSRIAMQPTTIASHRDSGRLPAPVTKLVGRVDDVAELKQLLSTSRLVTLTGVGGVGKTTLATHTARQLSGNFAGAVWLVELGDLHDSALLIDVVAAAVGVRNQSAGSLVDVIIEFLSARDALLVLDNCEHLIEEAAELVRTLLRRCPHVHVLATSREVLGVEGESVLPVQPLPCPDIESDLGMNRLSDCAAVTLFVERGRAAVPSFALTERNASTVARICAQLDGVPLALELAAARLRSMSLRQIAEGLSDRYALLSLGRRGAPRRQQTLTWCVKWSYDLCTPAEQQLWSQLSVFAGGFDLAAAQNVCGEDVAPADLLDQLSALVDKSILIRVEQDDSVRFRLLELLREFGKGGHDGAADRQDLCRRHADFYRNLVTDAELDWFGPRQEVWIRRLTQDMPNIREALQYTLSETPQHTLQMLSAMRPMWLTGAMLAEARHWLELALAATVDQPSPHRIKALCATANVADLQHDVSSAEVRLAEARLHLETVSDPALLGLVDGIEAITALLAGDVARAHECLRDGSPMTDDPEVQALMLHHKAGALLFSGQVDQATSCFEQALALTEAHGEMVWRTKILAGFGLACCLNQEHERADELLRRGLELSGRIDDPYNAAHCAEILAWIATAGGDMRRATLLMAAAAALSRAVGAPVIGFASMERFHHECERQARKALGPAGFDAAWQEGSSLSLAQTIEIGAMVSSPSLVPAGGRDGGG